MDYVNNFKRYVPAEVLAAYIALNALMPISGTGTRFYLIAGAVIPLIFLVYAIWKKMFKSILLTLIVTASVPIWGLISASARLEQEYEGFDTAKIAMLATLVVVSLVLTLFAPKAPAAKGKASGGATGGGA